MNSEFTIAVHSLVLLAYLPGRMASSETIAENVQTNPARIRKVMGVLRRSGFVETREGMRGGYRLAVEPGEVTLGDIYRAMAAGSLMPTWCSGDPEMDCVVGSNMRKVMDGIFCEAEKRLESYLDSVTIQHVLARIRECRERRA
ncbi:MAG: Rrf2 family transcriptional regulator [Thermobacillus sp. ZCTH02-B1]|uniref:RrF2 family transcriptional regulator n=1 Tax=Thermobacillus sp. ZCTH02-B1 TaxID=1858795 RepID=UPI000B5551DE|nr:Rrf2 family transcriptional regulator [Thermobacillus sp. ZCTH02-B1]OUM94081.1 MAG: Rrf2 family transcriptional regulator [Thermobacillus sp. ZCTH02-B1]